MTVAKLRAALARMPQELEVIASCQFDRFELYSVDLLNAADDWEKVVALVLVKRERGT